jgi:hypothetical protein
MDLNAKTAAIVIGILLLAIGILGFFANPLISPAGIFAVNMAHNLVHLITGAVVLAGAYSNLGATLALKVIGIVYAAMAMIGFVIGGDTLLGLVAVNHADHWLHVALAIVILAAGFLLEDEPAMA